MGVGRNNRVLPLIAAAAGASLCGLLLVQMALLRRNLEWKSQAFRQDAAGALASVVEKLEALETLKRIWTVSFMNKGDEAYALLSDGQKGATMFALRGDAIPKVAADGGNIILTLSLAQRVRLLRVEPVGQADTVVMDEVPPAGRVIIRLTRSVNRTAGDVWFKLFLDDVQYDLTLRGGRIVSILAHPTIDQSRAALIDKVLEQYLVIKPAPIAQRVDAGELKAAVDEALRERGLDDECVYGVVPAGRNEVILASDPSRREELLRTEFRTRLFPHDMTVSAGDLVFFFPGGEGSLVARLGAPGILAVLFILASVLCLFLVLRAAAGQKRAAAAMSDFVNNMTHEFKTPISTISLACDALSEEPVRGDRERRAKYEEMIRSECLRMQGQVRKILETAALERGDLDLRFERTDAKALVRKAVEAFSMIVASRGGTITARFETADASVEVDPVHFRNVLHNLLDNSVQYTRRPPEIVVVTEATDGRLRIAVTDNGIGLSPEDQKRVFERYYRVPTGNVHDVKGFGLGLSYVKLIVKAHGGSVAVRSEAGKGSTFEIEIPRRRKARGRGRTEDSG
jgi:signal transduction histidine kinase